ncbi:MAG: molecular chaperone TorD family protein [Deltaproteobacteria bacterium]|nr:molecular chaperone TorD family protein [Deltaproteobacteria bacterium]
MLADTDIAQFRLEYYSLFVNLLATEPKASLLSSLKEGGPARIQAAARLHPQLGEGLQFLQDFLRDHDAKTAAEEFNQLFCEPYRNPLNPYESYYLTGQVFRRPLAKVRSFLAEVGLERDPDAYVEPEDVLAFELEILRWLVEQQLNALGTPDEERWLLFQARFLSEHLLVWGPVCAKDLTRVEDAHFYAAVGRMLEGFFALEQDFFREWRPLSVTPLAEARAQYQEAYYKGPVVDSAEDIIPPRRAGADPE